MKQDKGARVFAAIAIFLFACYFIGALTAHAQEGSPLAKYGTATAAGSSSARFGSLQVDEPYGLFSRA